MKRDEAYKEHLEPAGNHFYDAELELREALANYPTAFNTDEHQYYQALAGIAGYVAECVGDAGRSSLSPEDFYEMVRAIVTDLGTLAQKLAWKDAGWERYWKRHQDVIKDKETLDKYRHTAIIVDRNGCFIHWSYDAECPQYSYGSQFGEE